MVFVVPGVARYSINHVYEGRSVVNVLDMDIDPSNSGQVRSQTALNVAGDILDTWAANMMPDFVNDLEFVSVGWTDLNDALGSTGSITSTVTTTLPVAGGDVGAPLPGNVAALVDKNIITDRTHRSGRWYLAGGNENWTDLNNANTIPTSIVAALNTNLAVVLSDLFQDGQGPGEYQALPVVVHILTREDDPVTGLPTGPPLTGDSRLIESFTVQGLLATQRRRLRG